MTKVPTNTDTDACEPTGGGLLLVQDNGMSGDIRHALRATRSISQLEWHALTTPRYLPSIVYHHKILSNLSTF